MTIPKETATERRAQGDRRAEPAEGRRLPAPSGHKRILMLALRDGAAVIVLVAAIVYAVLHVRPIFAGKPTVVQSLVERVPVTRPLLAPAPPPDTGRLATLLASPRFEADRKAFAADLARTGRKPTSAEFRRLSSSA
jgi:hypothetical protein